MTRKEFLLSLPAAALASRALGAEETPKADAAAASAEAESAVPATTAAAKTPPVPALKLPPIQPGPPYLLAGPMLGHVSHEEARLWIRATKAVAWKVVIAEAGSPEQTREIVGSALNVDTECTGIAKIEGLKAATRYVYQVVLDGRDQLARPLPEFTTAPSEAHRMRVAFGSCVGDSIAAASPAWAELSERRELKPEDGGFELLLMLGDNHYANSTETEKLRTYYTVHRLSAGWRELSARVPVYAIWDDHDYGPNDSDGTQKGKENSLRIFQEYWANPGCGEPENPGCYFTFVRGDVQFFMLDGRYHRTPNKAPAAPDKTMFGAKQIEWLKRELAASKVRVKLLANGSEWESFGSEDSYKSFLPERDALFKWIDEQKIEGVIFLSGDRHFSSGYHIKGRFLELSSGPFGSKNATLRPNPERFTGHDEGRLWFILDIDTTQPDPAIAYELWQAGGGRLERRSVTWDQVHGREKIALAKFPLKADRIQAKPEKNMPPGGYPPTPKSPDPAPSAEPASKPNAQKTGATEPS